jgi:agmatinase
LARYEPADSFETPRFSDVRTYMRLPNVRDLENSDVAISSARPSTPAPPSAPAPDSARRA